MDKPTPQKHPNKTTDKDKNGNAKKDKADKKTQQDKSGNTERR